MPPLSPYKGNSRKIVLALDVGTTYSGVSYAVLDPGDVPTIRTVSRYPGQGAGDAKIPTVICYTQDGLVETVGAEAADDTVLLRVKEEGLVYVEQFKMHLRPSPLVLGGKTDMTLKPLPKGKTAVDVFADFLSYLFACTKAYIQEAHPNGESLWSSVERTYDVILSHPNGWGGSQQAKMRDAAIRAGLLPDTPAGHQRLHFVTEGEASINYCVGLGLADTGVNDGDTVLVIDAGGGTIDISSYCFKKISPLALEETAPAECLLHGATTVNDRAERLLRSKLANSRYGGEEDLATMINAFEWSTKRSFRSATVNSKIKFGTIRDHDKEFGISFGQITLAGTDVARMFEPSIDAIVAAVESQRDTSSETISLAFLVGGFAASPFLFSQVKARLGEKGISLSRPENSTAKAVSDGAIWHYLGGYIAARVAGWTFGTASVIDFDVDDPEHLARKEHLVLSPSGMIGVAGNFAPLIVKGARVKEGQEVSKTFCREAPNPLAFSREIEVDILCYHGDEACPKWIDRESDAFKTKCTVRADTSNIDTMPMLGRRGLFCVQAFEVVLSCGTTEMRAFIRWGEDGVEKRGDAQIVYEDDTRED